MELLSASAQVRQVTVNGSQAVSSHIQRFSGGLEPHPTALRRSQAASNGSQAGGLEQSNGCQAVLSRIQRLSG
eukprot:5497687-Pyramimonas_sp.AAC.1